MFGLTTTRRLRAELDAARAETNRQRERAETAEKHAATAVFNRKQVLRQLAHADADNRRLNGRLLELGRRLTSLTEADPEYAARLERRVARLLAVAGRLYLGREAEQQRAEHLQQRLDDACGLNDARVEHGRHWQETRDDKRWAKEATS
ncbi:hypothetical protein [Streptomyces sp. ALI-76-A]|uniref:hypothetical protein n=1 Tax=Streptomyces sp. ALI-76-A TaxID=3025736 RepID=UPI00256EE8E1|nr:hypothetical protein [Streptomyces sp. ALI-76-A]MDL5205081.1 hypothetical protein [Streptomyces sp. ALI-76-A]